MSIADILRGIVHNGPEHDEEIVGIIVEGPTELTDQNTSEQVVVFQLDSRPDLLFRQPIRALAPERHKGDRVRAHCRLDGTDTAIVDWVEKA